MGYTHVTVIHHSTWTKTDIKRTVPANVWQLLLFNVKIISLVQFTRRKNTQVDRRGARTPLYKWAQLTCFHLLLQLKLWRSI